MKNKPIVAQDLKNDIMDLLIEAEIYLDAHLIYNHTSQDISETFREKIQRTFELVSTSQESVNEFQEYQKYANQFSLFVITQIKYPKDEKDNFIFQMRKLTDLLGIYTANCAPSTSKKDTSPGTPKKSASHSKLFKNKPDDALDLEPHNKPIREESFNHR